MKTTVMIIALFALAVAGAAEKTVSVNPGDRVIIEGGGGSNVSRTEIREVVWALETLLKYAPEKYENDDLIITGTASSGLYYTTLLPQRKTKADKIREEAVNLERKAEANRKEAKRADDEQAGIERARAVLAAWKARI